MLSFSAVVILRLVFFSVTPMDFSFGVRATKSILANPSKSAMLLSDAAPNFWIAQRDAPKHAVFGAHPCVICDCVNGAKSSNLIVVTGVEV